MNILFITTHVNTGGITSYLLTLGGALVKSGHKVWVASSGGDCEDRFKEAGITHVPINIRTKSEIHPKLFFCIKPLETLIKDEAITVIHAQTRVTQVLGAVLSRLTGVKFVTTCHGFFRPRLFRKMFPCWGEQVIAISKPVQQHLIGDFAVEESRVYLIPNGIDLKRFVMNDENSRRKARQKWSVEDAPLIGIIARLSDVKGIDVLLRAMPYILKVIPSAKLLIAGQGPHETFLKDLTKELSLTAQVQFRSIMDQPEGLLPAFDVFVMPSLMEGLGLSVIEAQACGIPVVASRIGGLIDLINDGKSGYLVPIGDPEALAERIVDVLQNPRQAKLMAELARSNVEEKFSDQRMLNETLKVYEQYYRG